MESEAALVKRMSEHVEKCAADSFEIRELDASIADARRLIAIAMRAVSNEQPVHNPGDDHAAP